MPKAGNSLFKRTNEFRKKAGSFLDKYLMHTYQASVRAHVKGRSQVIKTEVRAMNAQEARWLIWAQFGFHSIQAGPVLRKSNKQP
jgi:hypothetical protein